METTIITLAPSMNPSNMTVRTTASFEEAFGDYSNAKGRGRARRKSRKLERITNKQEVKQARVGGRQEARISRRSTRKSARQEMRDSQQQARMERRGNRRDERQESSEARQLRRDTANEGKQGRKNYKEEQEIYREGLRPEEEEETQTQGGSDSQDNGSDSQQGGGGSSDDQQGGGGSNDWGSAPQGYNDQQGGGGYSDDQQGYNDQQSDEGSNDWGSAPQGYDEGEEDGGDGAYGDDNRYDSPYVQEDSEFSDDSYFNVEGMDGKSVVSPMVKDSVAKLRNNQRAFSDLSERRNVMLQNGDNTRGIEMQLRNCQRRINELKSSLDSYANADGNPERKKRRRVELTLALGRGKKRRKKRTTDGGSEVPVSKELNPDFKSNRIEIPAQSGFDGYSDLGRPVFIDGVEQSDKNDYTNNLYNDGSEPTTIDMFSSADGVKGSNTKVIMSIAIGIGVGALAIYLAKKKGWI